MKWLWILLIPLLLIPVSMVEADTSQGLTITVSGYAVAAPSGLVITYVDDMELDLTWAKGAHANNTMIRAAYGRYPTTRTDGYLVYYGNGTYASDTAVNLDETPSLIYYAAFSESAGGVWETTGTSEWYEGDGMRLIAIVILALGLMLPAFLWKKQALMLASMFAWVGFAFYNRTLSPTWGTYDIYEILFYVGIVMVFLCLAEGILLARNARGERLVGEAENAKAMKKTETQQYVEEYKEMMQQVRDIRGLPRL